MFIHPRIADISYYHVDHTREDGSATHSQMIMIIKENNNNNMHLEYLKHLRLGPWIYNKTNICNTQESVARKYEEWKIDGQRCFLDLRHIRYYVHCSQMDI